MAEVIVTSCQVCLRPEELDSVILVEIPHAKFKPGMEIVLCRDCAFAVAKAVKATGELPPIQEVSAE